jgi:hypothetical protein
MKMKHVKLFEQFAERTERINEYGTLVSDPSITDEATLRADILKKAGPALEELLKKKGVKWPGGFKISEVKGRNGFRLELESSPITGTALGIMQFGFDKLYLNIFNGGNMPSLVKDGDTLTFEPYIWITLHYSYTVKSGGSNGIPLFLPGESRPDLWYDVLNGEWLTTSAASKLGI